MEATVLIMVVALAAIFFLGVVTIILAVRGQLKQMTVKAGPKGGEVKINDD